MAEETREEKIRRIKEKFHADRGFVYDMFDFGIERDPDYWEVQVQVGWGFFKEEPRYLEPKMRELIEIGVLAFRGLKYEVYTHTKKAIRLGATVEECMEAFEVAAIGGGGPVRMMGLEILKRIVDEAAAEGIKL